MAQKILLRRGPIANLAGAASSQGELLLATGVISDLTGPFLTMTGTSGTGTSTIVGKIYEGNAAPTITTNSPLTGLPFYESGTNTLVRLNHAGNQALDLTGNLEGNAVSSMTISQLVGNVAIVGDGGTEDGDLSVAGLLTVTGDISGSNLNLTGNANIDGNITLGGNINIGDADTDTITLGGEITSDIIPDADSTYSLGSSSKRWLNIYVDALTGDTATLSSNATIGGTLGVTGATTLDGATDINSTLAVSGDITLDASGTQNITHTGATGNLVISSTNGTVEVNGVLVDNDGNTQVPGTISTPNSTIGDDISIPGYLSVGGYSNLGTGDAGDIVTISGSLDMNGDSTFSGNITLDGASDQTITNTNGTLFIDSAVGGTTFGGNVTLDNNLDVTGTSDFNNTVNISGAVTLDGSGAQTITQTGTGNLTISSDNGDVFVEGTQFSGNDIVVAGNLTVSGTTTTIDSTTVQIGDNIIELNAAGTAADGGIVVQDVVGSATDSGSLLWNATSDYWYAGTDGATHYRLATFENQTPADNAVPRVNSDKRLVAGSISDTGALVTVSSKTVLSDAGGTDALSTSSAVMFRNSSDEVGYVSTTISSVAPTGMLGYNNSTGKLEFSNVIDGGTF